jgi:L-alanine-DL-glutamate epimerase-like enolase superfamily enzyme
MMAAVRVTEIELAPLSVPLREPFVIASAAMTHTRAVLVRVRAAEGGQSFDGFGEAAALPPVTAEDQPDLLRSLALARDVLLGADLELADVEQLTFRARLAPVANAALECALLDALARHRGIPLYRMLGASEPCELDTDITLPIAEPEHLARLARSYYAQGFRSFKVKVGKDLDHDCTTLRALAEGLPAARVRLDANEGYDAGDALRLLDEAERIGLVVECFEQPCRRDDFEAMARVAADGRAPVVADESCRSLADVDALVAAGAAQAVNLKLAKMAGISRALAIGRHARACGLKLMAGAMVETKLGLAAMAHVVTALGGVDWLDLDTAFLLADDPFVGGYTASGSRLFLSARPGLGLTPLAY